MIEEKLQGDWGSMLNEYYQLTRHPLPGELDFWKGQISQGDSVIEIGAGQGFITKHLVEKQPSKLLLVEPCESSARYLEPLSKQAKFIDISYDLFETCDNLRESDCILFPYDSLPMVNFDSYDQFFAKIRENLTDSGKFVFHISTKKWNEEYISKFEKTYRTTKTFPSGRNVTILAWAEKHSDSGYTKYFCFIDSETRESEYYQMTTNIIDEQFVQSMCQKHQLSISDVKTSFDDLPGEDDLVITLIKQRVAS